MMKKFLFVLMLLLVAVMVQPAHATMYTGEITGEYVSNPFSVDVGDTFTWEAIWTGTPTDGWVSADKLRIPVDPYLYREDGDADYASGWPKLLFSSGALSGVDALFVDWLRDGNTYYHFTTLTPVGGPYNYLTFSVFSTNNSMASYYEELGSLSATTQIKTEVLSGVLYTKAVPIPAPILLLGTGLVGLAGFRRKMKRQL